jgi:hypothetical protein
MALTCPRPPRDRAIFLVFAGIDHDFPSLLQA